MSTFSAKPRRRHFLRILGLASTSSTHDGVPALGTRRWRGGFCVLDVHATEISSEVRQGLHTLNSTSGKVTTCPWFTHQIFIEDL